MQKPDSLGGEDQNRIAVPEAFRKAFKGYKDNFDPDVHYRSPEAVFDLQGFLNKRGRVKLAAGIGSLALLIGGLLQLDSTTASLKQPSHLLSYPPIKVSTQMAEYGLEVNRPSLPKPVGTPYIQRINNSAVYRNLVLPADLSENIHNPFKQLFGLPDTSQKLFFWPFNQFTPSK